MLVLTRRTGESIMIGDEVTVSVLEVRGDVVRLGISAPRSVKVHREEVYREIQAANEAAASPAASAVAALAKGLSGAKPANPNPLGLGLGKPRAASPVPAMPRPQPKPPAPKPQPPAPQVP